jgi:DNA-binding MarR family transcriptional regulator
MSVNATKWAWEQRAGGSTEKSILLALADWSSPHDGHSHEVCWHAQSTIAKRAECSTKTVERVLKSLEEKRLIKRVPRYSNARIGGRSSDLIYLNLDGELDFTDNLSGKGLTDNLSDLNRQPDGGTLNRTYKRVVVQLDKGRARRRKGQASDEVSS